MIVTCGQCETQFQLDDDKIPARGARVRCSRCKNVFFIESPAAAAQDVADGLAREALDPKPAAPAGDDSEADWQFNEAPRAARGRRPPSRSPTATEPRRPA